MRTAILATSAVLLAVCIGAGDAPKIHSFSARSAIEKRDALVKRAYQDYLTKTMVADKQLIAALDQSLRDAMNNNDLAEATAINTVKKEAEERVAAAQQGNATSRVAGTRWQLENGTSLIKFVSDGTLLDSAWKAPGRWSPINENSVMVIAPNNVRAQVTFDSNLDYFLWVYHTSKPEVYYATRMTGR